MVFFNPYSARRNYVLAHIQDAAHVTVNNILISSTTHSLSEIKEVICRGYQRQNFGYMRFSDFERFRSECLRRVLFQRRNVSTMTEYGLPYLEISRISSWGLAAKWERSTTVVINDPSMEREEIAVEGDLKYLQAEL